MVGLDGSKSLSNLGITKGRLRLPRLHPRPKWRDITRKSDKALNTTIFSLKNTAPFRIRRPRLALVAVCDSIGVPND